MTRMLIALSAVIVVATAVAPSAAQEAPHWRLTGDLSEACTCAVPCACNFGSGPSPHSWCYAVFSLNIVHGTYGSVTLDGLHLAGANGAVGSVWYYDSSASPEQAAALSKIARYIYDKDMRVAGFTTAAAIPKDQRLLGILPAHITQSVGSRSHSVRMPGIGGFEADYILGYDHKTPVVVENNTSWNIPRSTKARTHTISYKDRYGNAFHLDGTNSNEGAFDWSDATPDYIR